MKLKRKKISIVSQANYDIFNPQFNPKPETELLKKIFKTAPVVNTIENNETVYIGQNVYIRPSYIVSLPEYSGSSKFTSLDFKANQANLLENSHKGLLSSKAVGKMRNSINWLLCAAETKKVFNKKFNSWFDFKINFITLTLPDTTDAIDNKHLQKYLLNPFLTYLRTFHSLKNYVWKLEFQKNGKLHVHLLSDVFIHHQVLRRSWNSILGKNGHLIEFGKKFGHTNPPSTDIHSVRKIKNIAAYISKYMSKNAKDLEKIKGRIWGCNQELSKANNTKLFIDRDSCVTELKPLMNSDIKYKPIETENSYTKLKKTIGEIFFINYIDWFTTISGSIQEKFNETILELKNASSSQNILFTV